MLRVIFVGKGGVSAASSNYLSSNSKLVRARKLQKFEKDKAVDVARFRNNERGQLFIILAPPLKKTEKYAQQPMDSVFYICSCTEL